MRNDPAPKKYMDQGLSPLHSRTMSLFDSLKDDYHHCTMDNLYNSTAFCKAAVNHKRKVLCHGVTRKGMRGIPTAVIQNEVKNRKEQLKVRGTVKAAVLENDPKCRNLVASSVYDTKPVHYLSMVCNELKWVEVERDVFNVDSGKREKLTFLRMNTIDNYNKTMGYVDIADQLRGNYRCDHWLRNRKWWWSLFFWALGVMLTNAYVSYLKVNEEEGVPKKQLLSHHDFQKAVALYWINPQQYHLDEQKQKREDQQIIRRKRSSDQMTTCSSSFAMNSAISTTSPNKKARSSRISSTSLLPNGSLSCRLMKSLDHLPENPSKKKSRCSLHRWLGYETQKGVMYCPSCNVNLCIDCYKIFHNDDDIVNKKLQLQKKLKPNK